jgi:tol-pal system protein YbgF
VTVVSRTCRAVVLSAFVAAGCATKRDVQDVAVQVADLRARQDSTLRALRALTDTVRAQGATLWQVRGDLARQLFDIEQQLVQIQELIGQSQAVLSRLRARIGEREEALETPPTAAAGDTARPPPRAPRVGDAEAQGLFAAAMEQYRRGAYATSREGFQQFVTQFAGHELAPEAQYYVGETYREEKDWTGALREYARVLELYPNSKVAPRALYKSGLVEADRGNVERACEFFRRTDAGYPNSDEARLARDQMRRLRCR